MQICSRSAADHSGPAEMQEEESYEWHANFMTVNSPLNSFLNWFQNSDKQSAKPKEKSNSTEEKKEK